MRKYKQGRFTPKNPQKYRGNLQNIIYRSSWELKFLLWLDSNNQVLEYSSEETVIPYISPVDDKYHRYFLDFRAKIRSNTGEVKTYLIEVKPENQIQPPKLRKATEKYLKEVMTYAVNQAKWAAAKQHATERGYVFTTLNEYDLGIAKRK